jgi:hypothetical protein
MAKSQAHASLILRGLQEIPKGVELWCEPYCIVEEGDPAEKILETAARYGANVIVLGIRPHSIGLATHLARPTAHRVVAGAACPVLTVRGWGREVYQHETDLTGVFCTSGSEREFTLEERWYADEEIQA